MLNNNVEIAAPCPNNGGLTPEKAFEILNNLQGALPPKLLIRSLADMMAGFFMYNEGINEEIKDEAYVTFTALADVLKALPCNTEAK